MAKPKWDLGDVLHAANTLHELTLVHRDALEPRLPAGALDRLESDGASLRAEAESIGSTRGCSRASTQAKLKALEEGVSLVGAFRDSVRSAFPEELDIQRLFGIGRRVRANVGLSVSAALHTVLEASKQRPDAVRAAGLLDSDLGEARAAHAALGEASLAQGGKRLDSKRATAQRDESQLHLERSLESLVATAAVALRRHPELVAQFRAALPSRRRSKRRRPVAPAPVPTLALQPADGDRGAGSTPAPALQK